MSGFELSGCVARQIMYHASRWGRRRDSWVGIRWRRPFWSSPSSLFLATPQRKLKTCSGRSRTRSGSSRARARSPCTRPPINAARGNRRAAARRRLAHRAPAQRSRLPGFVVARPLRRDRGQALSAEPARLGQADADRHLLRPQFAAAPLRAGLRTALFLGQGARGLRPARSAHRRPIWIAPEQARRRDR